MATYAATAARLAANIANAQASTGPKTPDGKAASSRNAFKHGLASANLYVPEALKPLYAEITHDLNEAIHPEGTLEDDAFTQLRNARFQMERILILQAELGQKSALLGLDPLQNPAVQKQWDRLERYLRTAESSFRAHRKELRKLQSDRAVRKQLFRNDPPPANLTDYRPAFAIGRAALTLRQNEAVRIIGVFNRPIPART